MSASNWRICPVCLKRAKEELEDAFDKLSEDEYNELKEKVNNPYNHYETLREDYEHNTKIDDDGNVILSIYYSIQCEHCGLIESLSEKKKVAKIDNIEKEERRHSFL